MEIIRQNTEAQREFVSGIKSLDCVVSVLDKTQINKSTSAVAIKEVVRRLCSPIRQAHANLTKSLELWEEENAKLSARVERSVVEVGNVKKSISEKQQRVAELNQQLDSLRNQIANNERELEEANCAFNRANDVLRNAERELSDKKREQGVVAGVGAGLFAIPVIGWIAGATMLTVSFTALEDAVNAAKGNVGTASNNVSDCSSRLQAKTSERNCLGEQLSTEERRRADDEARLRQLEAEVNQLQEQQKKLLEMNEKLKNTCHVMTTMWGKSRVLESETHYAYSLEPMIPPLQEIIGMFSPEEQTKIKNSTFLCNPVDFSAISAKLKAVCERIPDNSLAILDV